MGLPGERLVNAVRAPIRAGGALRDRTTQAPWWISSAESDRAAERARMVEHLRARGIRDPRVLAAMNQVPRHLFVPEAQRPAAYSDSPLPIGNGQTISQPYIVAFMTESLQVEPEHRVLEIGTGSGYQTAVLSLLAREVYSIEIIPPLAHQSETVLRDLGYRNVHLCIGNGYRGWPEHAPFDRVIVTAAPDEVPRLLVGQLMVGGSMVIPVGSADQELQVLERTDMGTELHRTLPVRFVPMTGRPTEPGSG